MKCKINVKYFTNEGINGHNPNGHFDCELGIVSKSILKDLIENYLPERRQELTESYGNIGFAGIGIYVIGENGNSFLFSANPDDITQHSLKHLSYENIWEVEVDHREIQHKFDEERRLLPYFCSQYNLPSTNELPARDRLWPKWEKYFKANMKPFKFE